MYCFFHDTDIVNGIYLTPRAFPKPNQMVNKDPVRFACSWSHVSFLVILGVDGSRSVSHTYIFHGQSTQGGLLTATKVNLATSAPSLLNVCFDQLHN